MALATNTKALDEQYLAHTYARYPLEIVSGEGAIATAADGKTYIDMEAGYGTNVFGFCDPAWVAATEAQLHTLQHTSNLYYTAPYAQLAALLTEKSGMQRVYFANSGGEANECAIKAARKYARQHKGKGTHKIIAMKNAFHGRSYGALSATDNPAYQEPFLPMLPGFTHIEFNDGNALRAAADDSTAAIMLEFVQGEGGVNVVSEAFAEAVADLCAEKDILLIADEVQCGNGRTGAYYAYQHYDLQPDIVTTAKGLGGGLPIGACLFGERTAELLEPGDHGSTYGGNPVACAGAISVMQRLDDALLASVKRKSMLIRHQLQHAPGVAEITGLGLMLGVRPERGTAAELVEHCLAHGVLTIPAGGNKLRLLPPLNIPDHQLAEAMTVIKDAFRVVAS